MLYALSFMSGGSVHIWAQNKTDAVIKGTSSFKIFKDFTKKVEETFGDPDSTRTACTKLHSLRMTSGMSADEYTAQFKILVARMSFNDPALEDAYSHGLTAMILDKNHAQPSLSKDLKAWKESACQIDWNHRRLLEVKQGQVPLATTRFTAAWTNTIPVPTNPVVTKPLNTSMPMDIDSDDRHVENRTCYNCNKRGHISPHCPEPHKQ